MSATALPGWFSRVQRKRALRVLLSDYVLNGASCAMGMLLVSAIMHAAFGAAAAATATVGVIATLAPDMVGPRRGKLAYMIAAPLIGMPLFLAVQLLRADPVVLGVFMVGATFVAFLGMAWGKRGAPVAIGVMLAVIFALSTPPPADVHEALVRTLYGALGSFIYVLWSVLSNLALNARYRTQRTADLLLALAALMRAHALRIAPDAPPDDESDATGGVAELLRRQAALADQLQAARDVVLESPRTPHRQRLAGMLMVVLEMRDYLVAGELDLERVRHHAGNEAVLAGVADVYRAMAADVVRIADALLLGRKPVPATDHGAQLAELAMEATSTADELPPPTEDTTTDERRLLARLLRGVAFRVTHQNRAVLQLSALARGEAAPDLDVVRNSWRLFVSPT
ncbi:MAG: FUSC family protein, partial [Ottowia sp.]|nr:FUSC family protein [Ottowia sp.]